MSTLLSTHLRRSAPLPNPALPGVLHVDVIPREVRVLEVTTTVQRQPLCGVIPRSRIHGAIPGGYPEYPGGFSFSTVAMTCTFTSPCTTKTVGSKAPWLQLRLLTPPGIPGILRARHRVHAGAEQLLARWGCSLTAAVMAHCAVHMPWQCPVSLCVRAPPCQRRAHKSHGARRRSVAAQEFRVSRGRAATWRRLQLCCSTSQASPSKPS